MSEQADRLKQRIFQFAIDVIDLITQFSKSDPGATVVRQLAKSATSVGANYRAALRASWEYHVENFLGMLQLPCAPESCSGIYEIPSRLVSCCSRATS